jgi:hypothetical protein
MDLITYGQLDINSILQVGELLHEWSDVINHTVFADAM